MKAQRNFLGIIFFICIQQIIAQQQAPLPESLTKLNPVEVFSSDKAVDYTFADNRSDVAQSILQVKTDTQEFPLYKVEVFNAGKSHYGVTIHWKSNAPVKKGDVMLARLNMRTISARQESGESNIFFYFQQIHPPHEKSFINTLATGNEWKTFDIPFIANHDMAAGEASVGIGLGALAQKVEISGVQILNFEDKVSQEELPVTRFTYAGREEKSEWRRKALNRIEEIRTAPLNIKVVDNNGKPVKGAKVAVRLQQSDFIWGTAVNERLLGSDHPHSETYKKYLTKFFNTATIENGLKAYGWTWDEERKNYTRNTFEWLRQNGFRQRGHTLVWPGWKFNPRSTKELALRDTAAFNRFVKAQFYERIAITKGQLIAWDVVNEMMHEKDFFSYLPQDIVVEWFQLARHLDPDAQLFINEYGMLNGLQSPMNINAYLETINSLRRKGAPIDAIGIQGHVGRQPRNPEEVLTDLDLFVGTGLPVQITEFDINTPDEELQADYTRDFLIACYSHPIVTGITLWGFWEAQHWKPDAGMFRKDWTPKPSADVWREWVTGKWKTSFNEITDKKGEVRKRGHLGRYTIRVEYKGIVREAEYQLNKENEEVVIVLTEPEIISQGSIIHRFFDTSPVSPSGKYIALFRLPYENRSPTPGDVGEVVVIDLTTRQEVCTTETRGWEMQLGANVQWGSCDTDLFYNDVDTITWEAYAVRFNFITGEKQRLPETVFMVSADGKKLASYDLRKSRFAQVGYGVVVPAETVSRNIGPVSDDGIYVIDLSTNQCRMIASIRDIYEQTNALTKRAITYSSYKHCQARRNNRCRSLSAAYPKFRVQGRCSSRMGQNRQVCCLQWHER